MQLLSAAFFNEVVPDSNITSLNIMTTRRFFKAFKKKEKHSWKTLVCLIACCSSIKLRSVVLNRWIMAHWWATARKSGGPRLLILISTKKENITEIEKNITQLGHRSLCILKMGHMPKKVERHWLRLLEN